MIGTRLRTTLAALVTLAGVALVAAPRSASGLVRGAAALDQLVRGLTTTGRVLVIGAHPDDEDTQFLAWLARGHQVHAAYLSLSRGDGGQNIIGNELGEGLGAIRTEELLAARAELPLEGGDEAERLGRHDLVVRRADRTEDLDPFLREGGNGVAVGHGGLLFRGLASDSPV